ncbi:MAG: Zn-dependent oligopeptidase [Chloroflexi bacterium]|nr:Zn-dependent oligopeptidase [Chloroflexota bacterium]MDA1239837.1 Zn-dependent oligopeptidase [Chloroflexota bacterium]
MTDEHAAPYDFTAPTAEAIREGAEAAIRQADAMIAALVVLPDAERTFANTMQPLDEVGGVLGDASGQWGFLTYVHADPAIREVAQAAEQRLDTYSTTLGFREDLYRAVQAYATSEEARALGPAEARLLAHTLRDYLRNGFALSVEQRARVQELKERLVVLGVDFRKNIDEYEDALLLERSQLVGLPDSYIDGLQVVEIPEGPRHRVSLDYPELYPFLESAEDEELRRDLFIKNHLKAANVNLPLLAEAVAVRDEIATTLGYASWAAYVTETKMAKTPDIAADFLVDLQARVRIKAEHDIDELTESKAAHLDDPDAVLEIWDWRYYQQRVRRERYEVDQFAVAEYFPLQATLDGLFDVYQRAVGVRFIEVTPALAWHPDVRLYRVEDATDGHHIGHFYMDLHPRPGKYGHAAEFVIRPGRRRADGTYQGSVCSIVSNFTKPSATSPSLLRHSEVETLFHEFGHVLHQVMTRSPYVRFNGTNVERDFVEAPSQMLEHWVWDPAVLRGFTRHVRTGEPLPEDLLGRMVDAKNVASGLHYLRQIYFASLDLSYHAPGREKDTDALAEALHPVTGFPFVEGTHFQAGFGHLFGYDAGYYGYLWSQVFGDDMFSRFEQGDPAAGADYRRIILEPGGMQDGADLVREFLGREPRQEAFLREIGLES